MSLRAESAVIYVNSSYKGSIETGEKTHPFTTIQAAALAAIDSDTIKVAKGTYLESVSISSKHITLLGGFKNGSFKTRNHQKYNTIIIGNIIMRDCDGAIDGFTITKGNPGIGIFGNSGVTVSRCTVVNCGAPERKARGGGIAITGPTTKSSLVTECILRSNSSGRGAGIFTSDSTNVTIQDCLVEGNTGYDNHGGGVCVTGNARILRNIIRSNIIGEGEGFNTSYGSGFISQGTNTDVYSAYNIIYDNLAKKPRGASASFYDEGTRAIVEYDLIFKNRNEGERVSGLQFDGGGDYNGNARTSAIVRNCTIVDNMNAGFWVEALSDVTVTNSIIWNNGQGRDFVFDTTQNSTLAVSYCLFSQDPSTLPALREGKGNIHGQDPLFANPAANDYHLRSTAGRWNAPAFSWTRDKADSPAIDAADPSDSFENEPNPNGGRRNLGAYGNTKYASKSAKAK
ncbi:MAG TPA: right-handed parallel beta-helix repeat-containing protein [Flavitalea sp.]|nr:right-handed parallel beta-helix repeat-containing protein [Flavitalea sp.]